MAKKRTSFALSEGSLAMLKEIAEELDRSQAWVLENNIAKVYAEMGYAADGKYSTEEEATTGLDTCGYAGKWKVAKESVLREKPEFIGNAYWDAVRLYFLELGGCWLAQKMERSPLKGATLDWKPTMSGAVAGLVAARPYEGFTKVRQG